MKPGRVEAAAFSYFLLVTVWLTWPLLPRMGTALSSSPDSLLNAWALGWSFHILPREPLSLFDANVFFPRPDTLAYSEHLFGITVLVAPAFFATGNLVLAYNLAMFSSFLLSGIGMYLLVRELTRNRWAALAAGTIYLAAPYRFGHLLQLQLLTLQWFPFVFYCLIRFLREGRTRQLVGVVVFSLLQALSCNYYAVYLALALVVFAAAAGGFAREMVSRRKALSLLGGGALVFGLSLPFFLPYYRNQERGFYRRYEDLVVHSASARDYFTPSSFQKAPHWGFLPPARAEKSLFFGFGAVVLAGIGLATGSRRPELAWVFFTALVALGVLLSLGPEGPLPYRFLYRHVPGFGGMRAPARASVLALLGISALAGMGAAKVLSRASALAAPALVGFLLFEYQTFSLDRVLPRAPEIPEVHRRLGELETGAVLVLPIHEGRDIVHESLAMYYATAHFLPLVNGYSGWWPNDYWELVGRLRHFPTARSLRFLLERAPVGYVVVHYGRIPEPRRRELEAGMERYRERMPELFRVGDDVVYEIREPSLSS